MRVITLARKRRGAVLHAAASFGDFVVAVDRAGHLVANARGTPSLDFDAVRAGENFSAVTAQNITTYAGSGTFTITATPEPATLVLTGLGLLALGLGTWRRRSGLIG